MDISYMYSGTGSNRVQGFFLDSWPPKPHPNRVSSLLVQLASVAFRGGPQRKEQL